VRVFQSTYVGRHDFPKSLPDFLLQQWFTLNEREYRTYVAIPRRRTITALVRGVVQSVAHQDHRDLRRYMTEWTVQGFIKELLSHRPGDAMTHLEWLRRPPRRRSMKTLLELFAKYQWL